MAQSVVMLLIWLQRLLRVRRIRRLLLFPIRGLLRQTNDLIAGQIDLSFASTPGVIQHIENGKLRALAVTSSVAH
jgi:hypothetical protein